MTNNAHSRFDQIYAEYLTRLDEWKSEIEPVLTSFKTLYTKAQIKEQRVQCEKAIASYKADALEQNKKLHERSDNIIVEYGEPKAKTFASVKGYLISHYELPIKLEKARRQLLRNRANPAEVFVLFGKEIIPFQTFDDPKQAMLFKLAYGGE